MPLPPFLSAQSQLAAVTACTITHKLIRMEISNLSLALQSDTKSLTFLAFFGAKAEDKVRPPLERRKRIGISKKKQIREMNERFRIMEVHLMRFEPYPCAAWVRCVSVCVGVSTSSSAQEVSFSLAVKAAKIYIQSDSEIVFPSFFSSHPFFLPSPCPFLTIAAEMETSRR